MASFAGPKVYVDALAGAVERCGAGLDVPVLGKFDMLKSRVLE
jgi:hypothetical protein